MAKVRVQCSCLPVKTEPGGGIEFRDMDENVVPVRVVCGGCGAGASVGAVAEPTLSSGAVSYRCNRLVGGPMLSSVAAELMVSIFSAMTFDNQVMCSP